MSRTHLWILTILLVGGAFAIWFVYLPTRQTDLQQRGKIGYGTVQLKDSRPIADGSMVYTLTFIFTDEQNRNHQVTVQMLDKGRWDSLKEKQDIKVRYLPEDPEHASLEGGERMVVPHSSALSFVAWSLLIAGIVAGVYASLAPKPERKPQNKVTVAKH
jgi:hypothetical protein